MQQKIYMRLHRAASLLRIQHSPKLLWPLLSQDGYKFDGWYSDEACTQELTGTPNVGDTYYAKWSKDEIDSIYGTGKNVDLGIIAGRRKHQRDVGFSGTIALDVPESAPRLFYRQHQRHDREHHPGGRPEARYV